MVEQAKATIASRSGMPTPSGSLPSQAGQPVAARSVSSLSDAGAPKTPTLLPGGSSSSRSHGTTSSTIGPISEALKVLTSLNNGPPPLKSIPERTVDNSVIKVKPSSVPDLMSSAGSSIKGKGSGPCSADHGQEGDRRPGLRPEGIVGFYRLLRARHGHVQSPRQDA